MSFSVEFLDKLAIIQNYEFVGMIIQKKWFRVALQFSS